MIGKRAKTVLDDCVSENKKLKNRIFMLEQKMNHVDAFMKYATKKLAQYECNHDICYRGIFPFKDSHKTKGLFVEMCTECDKEFDMFGYCEYNDKLKNLNLRKSQWQYNQYKSMCEDK